MIKYFAYGANCDVEVLKKRKVVFSARQRAVLKNHRLLFNKRSLRASLPETIGFANIVPHDDCTVEGILYEIGEEDLERLDVSERYPEHYDRIRVVVTTDAGEEECWAYKAQPDKVSGGLVPSRNYLNHIISASDFLSAQYIEAIDQSVTHTDECACCHRHDVVLFVVENDIAHKLCQGCREARIKWSESFHRTLTVPETESIMIQLVIDGPGFSSIESLIDEAVARKLI